MVLPLTAAAMRRCVPAAALLLGCVTPLVASGPAWASTASSATLSATARASTSSAAEELTDARAVYGTAVMAVGLIGAQSDRLAASAEQATRQAERLRAEVQGQEGGTIPSVVGRFFSGAPSPADRAIESADNAAHLERLMAKAERALDEAIVKAESARLAYDEVLTEQARRQAGWSAADAAEFARSLAQPDERYSVDDREQDARNREALARWEGYLDELIAADVVPPTADRLGAPGVAEVDRADAGPLVVLPSETVRAVSTAFGRLGLAKVPAAGTPSTFACGGLVADAWGATDQLPADSVSQWRTLAGVQLSDLQVGDVLVLGDRRDGLEQSGVFVGERQAIVADPLTGTASVRPVSRKQLYGVKRVGLTAPRTYDAPPAGACGMPEAPAAQPQGDDKGSVELRLPLAVGSYRISAAFGQSGTMWASTHSGQDFAAAIGTPVTAVAGGTVTVEKRAWAGNLVRVDHGGGIESWYAHLSTVAVISGQQVTAGEVIGAVGNEGNSTGSHLHLEVRLDGRAVPPPVVLEIPELPRTAHPRGKLPAAALCSAAPGTTPQLACEAAVSFRLMSAAFTAETGTKLCITDSYRPLGGGLTLSAEKRGLAKNFGTSLHGDGRAVDLCGGVERFDTPEHRWMATRGPSYGWLSPTWAAAGGSRPEPWHFESA
jgi:murein DD-endopeptidase MepM/ murein hydrolase activator NlpD